MMLTATALTTGLLLANVILPSDRTVPATEIDP